MKRTKTWAETWGKFDPPEVWEGVTAKEIDEMVKNGADVNAMHLFAIEGGHREYPKPIAVSEYPLLTAAEFGNLEACKALIKHGAVPQKRYWIFEDESKISETIVETIASFFSSKVLSYFIKQVKVPVTPKALIASIQMAPEHFKLLLNHFDLKAHPNLAKRLLKENFHRKDEIKLRMKIQSMIMKVMKNNQNKKTPNLKLGKINSGR